MAHLAHESVTDAPLGRVFDYLADSRNIQQWFYGVQQIEPLTDQIRGLGSTFVITLNVGRPISAKIRCTGFVENELITVETFDGPVASSRWTFAAEGEGTRIRGAFDYTLPGGLAGAALGRLVQPFASVAVKRTTANLLKYAGR
jgi:ligand-binding SRPBCC domain-containing protein